MTNKRVWLGTENTVCIDFDGVIHAHTSPWTTAGEVHDGPVDGALEAVKSYLAAGLCVVVQSARANDPDGLHAICAWLKNHDFPELEVTASKPQAMVYIDDRGFRFEGVWPSPELLRQLRPWNKS